MKRFGAGFTALVAVVAGACSDVSGPDGDSAFNADVAVVAADAALAGLSVMQDPGMGMHQPIDRQRTVTFLDANGAQQAQYDAATTASIHLTLDGAGSVERDLWSASVERHEDLTVSGLLGTETTRTWNGSGSESITRSRIVDGDGTRTYDLSGSFTISDVVVPAPGSDQRWPLSGTITRHLVVTLTGGPNGDQTRERTATITFNGTQTVTVNVNGDEFELDLGTRAGVLPRLRLRNRRDGR